MRYVGSKKRVAKKISEIVTELRGDRSVYWEPFCGGLNSFTVIAPGFEKAFASDTHPDLILFWSAVQNGWIPPTVVTEDQYQELRNAESSALRGFVGFGGSFGGKWFGGYARGGTRASGQPRNHQEESSGAAVKRMRELGWTSVKFACRNYWEGSADSRHVVYCDPPYAGTLGYNGTGDQFDSKKFWEWCREQSAKGALVLVSEYEAPEDFRCVAEFDHRMSVALTGDRRTTTERLFLAPSTTTRAVDRG